MSEKGVLARRPQRPVRRWTLDLRALALTRMGLAAWLLWGLVRRCSDWEWLYGARAIPSPSSALLLAAADTVDVSAASAIVLPPNGFLLGLQDGPAVTAFITALLLSYLCIGVGLFYRAAMLVALFGACAFAARQPLTVGVLDGAAFWWMAVLWLMPLDARWSLRGGGADRPLSRWERSATAVFITLVAGSLLLQGVAMFGVFGAPSSQVGWRPGGLGAPWGDALRIGSGVALCLAALAWSGLARVRWARGLGSWLWMLVACVSAGDGGYIEWIAWMLVLAFAGAGDSLFARWSQASGEPEVEGGANPPVPGSGSRWGARAAGVGLFAVVVWSVGGLVLYERRSGDELFAPRAWAPMEDISTFVGSDEASPRLDSADMGWLARWGFVVWRGHWTQPANTRRLLADALCMDAVGITADGLEIDLFAKSFEPRERAADPVCGDDSPSTTLDLLRRHPWARRALLTDLVRRAWASSDQRSRVVTVELRAFMPSDSEDAAPAGELLYSVSRPHDGVILGDFR